MSYLATMLDYLSAAAPPPSLDPKPQPLPGMGDWGAKILGYLKWALAMTGVAGLTICGIMMAIGRRNRSYLAGEGAVGIPWVFAGLLVGALAAEIVDAVLI